LQEQLAEEKRRREELEARLEAQVQQAAAAELARQQAVEAAERARNQHMMDWYEWMNSMAQRMGQSPLPRPNLAAFPPAPPPSYSPVSQSNLRKYVCYKTTKT